MKRLTDEQREIAARFVPLAHSTANRMGRRCGIRDREVAVELAMHAVVLAASGFDATKNANPAGWMAWTVPPRFATLAKLYRAAERRNRPFVREDTRGTPAWEPMDVSHLVAVVLSRMTPKQRRIVELAMLGDKTPDEIAEQLGVTRAAVSALLRSALRAAGAELMKNQHMTSTGCRA